MRVTTGAAVPDGTTAVVMVEDTKLIESSPDGKQELKVEILKTAAENALIREIGSDIAFGEVILRKGTVISSVGGEIGILASVGIHEINVYEKPVIGILSTGNELVSTDSPLKFGQIRDANKPALTCALKAAGYKVVDLGVASDNIEQLTSHIRSSFDKIDILVTTGGVSMGEMDLLKPVLERRLDGTIHFGRVNLKPGKPTTFATIPHETGHKLVFALPGNPVSALVTLQLFVLPCLKQMTGMSATHKIMSVQVLLFSQIDSRRHSLGH